MKHAKKLVALLLVMLLALSCLAGACEESEEASGALALQPGDALHGFTVTEVYPSRTLSSTIYTFTHAVSGATLVYVENDDPEVAFSIGYHTPYVDETDTNHVFEHAILSGSEKYPSKNLYVDLVGRAYKTYVNARTATTVTWYPVASLSEEQLYKMADAYLSCMVAPAILEDENIFKREAVRFELDDPDGDIAINGTVFAEDTGFLTDPGDACNNNLLDALYPGETTSNVIGQAMWHYDDLTYENTVATYERCYHFDNSLIFLYGDLDLERFLGFLDENYLSKYPAQGTDLSAWADGPAAPGFVDVQLPIPAYEGDTVEGNSVIYYAIDLDGATDVQLEQYSIFASLLNQLGSPLYNLSMERGIENSVSAGVKSDSAKPVFLFSMSYADPSQKDDLKALAEDALAQVASEGFDPAMLELVMKSEERSAKMTRNATGVGVSIVGGFLGQWAHSGDPNCYRVYEQAMDALYADGQQLTVRQMALNLLTPRRSALVTNVPTPGMAEAHDQALADYLVEMKANMTDEEITAMVGQTAAFNEWNAEEQPNNDFLISPADLPDPAAAPDWTKGDVDGVTVYRGETELSGVGMYSVYFDLSGMSREEMEYLMLTSNYRMQMDTTKHGAEEFYRLYSEYVSGGGSGLLYPNEAAGEYHRPMLCITWTSLIEDFDTSLDLILELYTQTDFSDLDMLTYLTAMSADYWDMSRQDANSTALYYAHSGAGLFADQYRFEMDVDGQDCYYLMADAVRRLESEEGFAQEWAARLNNAVSKAFTRDNLIFMCVADGEANDAIVASAVERLNALPEKAGADAEYTLPDMPKSLAICVESTINEGCQIADFMNDADFEGRYLPFWYALSDLYTTPTFRFKLGVYTAGNYYEWAAGCLATMLASDPNVRASVEALAQMPQALYDMELTEESLDGYILSAYSAATAPQGMLDEVMGAMKMDIYGADTERILEIKRGIRNATLSDQAEAAKHIAAALEDASYCVVGNEGLIRADADCFDEVISWRHGDEAEETEIQGNAQ
ncbi:MAG: insulinase family protein [Clostridia bacterium]|nr:insulinase family protein [Clostridia bacterium]